MFEQETIKHHIERAIVGYLQRHEYARFSDLRPRSVDTNLFTYHLKVLMKSEHVVKTEQGYTLGPRGLLYVDRVSAENMKLRTQPKIITMLLIKNRDGRILLHKRRKQPYINTWTLPYGKIHIDDHSVLNAAIRESEEKLHHTPSSLRHAGDCYIVVSQTSDDTTTITSRTLAHVVLFDADDIEMTDQLQWATMAELASVKLAPAVKEIVTAATAQRDFFFEEFQVASQ